MLIVDVKALFLSFVVFVEFLSIDSFIVHLMSIVAFITSMSMGSLCILCTCFSLPLANVSFLNNPYVNGHLFYKRVFKELGLHGSGLEYF